MKDFRRVPIASPHISSNEIDSVFETLSSGQLAQGKKVEQFEKEFARYNNVKYAIATNSGTSALHTSLLSLQVGRGDEVIVPDFTFFATASSVEMCGAKPIFADVDEKTFNITPETIENLFTENTAAVICANLFGQMCEVDRIGELALENEVLLIEDSAQSHGATFRGKKRGSCTYVSCFSFYPTKNMTTGEGGMVVTNNTSADRDIRCIINHGQMEKYTHKMLGFNYRMTDLAASIGIEQLKRLDMFNSIRKKNAHYYDAHINVKGIIKPYIHPDADSVYHQYVLRVTDEYPISREALSMHLTENGIGNAIHYPKPLHIQPLWKSVNNENICPITRQICKEVLSIPVHPNVSEEDLKYIVDVINASGD